MYFLPTVLKSIKGQGEKMPNSNKTLLDVVKPLEGIQTT